MYCGEVGALGVETMRFDDSVDTLRWKVRVHSNSCIAVGYF